MSARAYVNNYQIGGNDDYPVFLEKYNGKTIQGDELEILKCEFLEYYKNLLSIDRNLVLDIYESLDNSNLNNDEKLVKIRARLFLQKEFIVVSKMLLSDFVKIKILQKINRRIKMKKIVTKIKTYKQENYMTFYFWISMGMISFAIVAAILSIFLF